MWKITPVTLWVWIAAYAECTEDLILFSDAPGIIGSNITFTLKVNSREQSSYNVAWVEQVGHQMGRANLGIAEDSNEYTANWTLHYSLDYIPGTYQVIATVSYEALDIYDETVGTVSTDFILSRDFFGTLFVNNKATTKNSTIYVQPMSEAELSVELHDPHNYIQEAHSVTWSWYKDYSLIKNATAPAISLILGSEGTSIVNITLTAIYLKSSLDPTGSEYTVRGNFGTLLTSENTL